MQKTSASVAALITAASLIVIFICGGFVARRMGLLHFTAPSSRAGADAAQSDDQKFNLVCQVKYTLPLDGLDAPPKSFTDTLVGGVDYDNKSGWYQGNFGMTESRKGTLVTKGSKTLVSRPALFPRFGTNVTNEEFTIDRTSGEFVVTLTLQDGRPLQVIKGYCGKLTKAPF